jgi:hypothetical protein
LLAGWIDRLLGLSGWLGFLLGWRLGLLGLLTGFLFGFDAGLVFLLACWVCGLFPLSRSLASVMVGWLAKYASWFGSLTGLAVLDGMADSLNDWLKSFLSGWACLLAGRACWLPVLSCRLAGLIC